MTSALAFASSASTAREDSAAHPHLIRHNDAGCSSPVDVTNATDVTNKDAGGSSISDVTATRGDDARRPKIWSMAEIATSKPSERREERRDDSDSRDGSPTLSHVTSPAAAASSLMAAAQLSAAAAAAAQHTGKLPVGGATHAHLLQAMQKSWKVIRDEGVAQLDPSTGSFKPEEENLRETGDWKQFTLFQQGLCRHR